MGILDAPGLSKAAADASYSRIEQVSGSITLTGSGSPVREFYCTANATINNVAFTAGDTVVWRRLPTGQWGYILISNWSGPSNAYRDATTTDAPLLRFMLTEAAGAATVAQTGSAPDAGGAQITGVTFGAAPIGTIPSSALFDGTTSKILLPNVTAAQSGNGRTATTLEFVNYADFTQPPPGGYATVWDGAMAAIYQNTGLSNYLVPSGGLTPVPTQKATHVAITLNGTANKLYVNGALITTVTSTQALTSYTAAIGASKTGDKWFFKGRIAGICVYDKELAVDRILAHAKAAGLA